MTSNSNVAFRAYEKVAIALLQVWMVSFCISGALPQLGIPEQYWVIILTEFFDDFWLFCLAIGIILGGKLRNSES